METETILLEKTLLRRIKTPVGRSFVLHTHFVMTPFLPLVFSFANDTGRRGKMQDGILNKITMETAAIL